jgi:hypothetical protein
MMKVLAAKTTTTNSAMGKGLGRADPAVDAYASKKKRAL